MEKEKREFMKSERKKFNVDEFGRYRGGVPKPDWTRSVVGRLQSGNAVVSIASVF
jgi:hypothetical protein